MGTRGLALIIAGILLVSFLAQWPTHQVADWQLYSFYDPGTTLKGDWLLEKGYVPTVDFGYTHGLIPLLYGRVGFAVLGRTPWTFLALSVMAEMGMAWGLARILVATGMAKNWAILMLMLVGLPMAVMPAYLTLTHPLEAMLILLALAAQAEGNKSKALAIMTVCLFVKPSMAYVYGFVLVVLIVWEERGRWTRVLQGILPAAIALVMLMLALQVRFGWQPVIHTVLPFTGVKTYGSTNFGFFRSGLDFWWNIAWWRYLVAPPGVFLAGAAACALGAVIAIGKVFRIGAQERREASAWELLLTIGMMHTAFVLGFYGYANAWVYYAYLPVIGLVLFVLQAFPNKARLWAAIVCTAVMLVSHGELFGVVYDAWRGKTPRAEAGAGAWPGLWRYPIVYEQWQEVVKLVGDRPTLWDPLESTCRHASLSIL